MAKKQQHDDCTGKSHIRVRNELLRSDAYQALSVDSRTLLFEFLTRLTANNNGELFLSVTDATRILRRCPATIRKAFTQLAAHGFIIQKKADHYKAGIAREFQLTFKHYKGHAPLDTWRKWKPGKTLSKLKIVKNRPPQNVTGLADN